MLACTYLASLAAASTHHRSCAMCASHDQSNGAVCPLGMITLSALCFVRAVQPAVAIESKLCLQSARPRAQPLPHLPRALLKQLSHGHRLLPDRAPNCRDALPDPHAPLCRPRPRPAAAAHAVQLLQQLRARLLVGHAVEDHSEALAHARLPAAPRPGLEVGVFVDVVA